MSQPNYDYATLRHVVETKFEFLEPELSSEESSQRNQNTSSENPLQRSEYLPEIKSRKPHSPQYSQKNKRYECGCGFKGAILDFSIIPVTQIPSRRSKSLNKLKKPDTISQYPRRNIKMIGSELVVTWS